MSKARKLQVEVDATLKKVHEGVEAWEDDLKRYQSEGNNKETQQRTFASLKTDLKKLQKLREQVRGWITTGEIKGQDEALGEARRSIESCMERFKRCEKEHKITRFSSAGLKRDDTDPAVQAKIRCSDWLNDVVQQLETQLEQLEADLEALGPAATGRGKGKNNAANAAAAEKAKELSFQISRHQEYVSKVERVLRLLENDQVTPEEVEHALKDSLDYFIEAAYEEGAEFIEDEEIWSMLPLDAVEENVGKIAVHKPASETLGISTSTGSGGKEDEGPSSGISAATTATAAEEPPSLVKLEQIKETQEENEKSVESSENLTTITKPYAAAAAAAAAATDSTVSINTDASIVTGPVSSLSPGVSPTSVSGGFGGGGGGGGGGGALGGGGFPSSATPTTSNDTGTPSPGAGIIPTYAAQMQQQMQQQQQRPPAPPGFVHSVTTVTPGGAYTQTTPASGGPAPASAPTSPFKAASEQQQQQQQMPSSEEGSVNSSNEYLTGGGSSTFGSTSGFKSPFAAKAATEFTPQQSLDVPSSPSASYFAAAAAAAAAGGGPGTGVPPPPPGYTYPQGGATSLNYAATIPSAPTTPSPLGADWLSFSASWIAESDAQHSTATETKTGVASFRSPWQPTTRDVALIDAGAMQYRPITSDADWRKSDGSFSTPSEDFYFSENDNSGAGAGSGGSIGDYHPVSGSNTRPEWRPRYPTSTPLSYPTEVHPALKNETTFSKLQQETLFFSFFFHQGSRQQLFAANRLKMGGWRYHMKLQTWFARTMQPEVVTEEYEEGCMAYWDPVLRAVQIPSGGGDGGGGGGGGQGGAPIMAVGGWSRGTTAPNFRFEYALLENENTAVPSG